MVDDVRRTTYCGCMQRSAGDAVDRAGTRFADPESEAYTELRRVGEP